jgi:hypothetical protein
VDPEQHSWLQSFITICHGCAFDKHINDGYGHGCAFAEEIGRAIAVRGCPVDAHVDPEQHSWLQSFITICHGCAFADVIYDGYGHECGFANDFYDGYGHDNGCGNGRAHSSAICRAHDDNNNDCGRDSRWNRCGRDSRWNRCGRDSRWNRCGRDSHWNRCGRDSRWNRCGRDSRWNRHVHACRCGHGSRCSGLIVRDGGSPCCFAGGGGRDGNSCGPLHTQTQARVLHGGSSSSGSSGTGAFGNAGYSGTPQSLDDSDIARSFGAGPHRLVCFQSVVRFGKQ